MSVASDPVDRREPALDVSYSAEESARRRDEALRRALNTPPKPHKGKQNSGTAGKVKKKSGKSRA